MPRPPLPPGFRFNDVTPIWDHAVFNGSAKYDCGSEAKAIQIVHRLNGYRKILREQDPNGMCNLDHFVVRKYGTFVQILLRPSIDTSKITIVEGAPTAEQQVAQPYKKDDSYQRELERLKREQYMRHGYIVPEDDDVDFSFDKEPEIRDDIPTKKVNE